MARPLDEPPRSEFVLDEEVPASVSGLRAGGFRGRIGLLPSSLLARRSAPKWAWLLAIGGVVFAAIFAWAVWWFSHERQYGVVTVSQLP